MHTRRHVVGVRDLTHFLLVAWNRVHSAQARALAPERNGNQQ
jgi:hypothetical protein